MCDCGKLSLMATIVASPAELLAEHDAAIDACAFKEEVTPDEIKTRILELNLCSNNYRRFRRWCKLSEAPPPGSNFGGGVIPYETWPHTEVLINDLLTKLKLLFGKSRQIGVSWEVASYVLWGALHKPSFKALLFSKGLVEASELLAKSKFVYDQLPPYMQLKKGADSETKVTFPDQNSSIQAFPATETAGISFTASVIVWDEWEQHEYAERNFSNALPVIQSPTFQGQAIGIFTRDPYRATSLARTLFVDALANKVDWTPRFFGWRSRPGRTDEWYDKTKKSITTVDLGTLTPELYMRCNYPETIAEFLAPIQTTLACDAMVLDRMGEDCRSTVHVVHDGLDQGVCNIFKEYSLGAFYIAATDTSHGMGNDFSATVVLNIKTGEIVADILSRALFHDALAVHSVKMLEYYHCPLWAIEDNDWGAATIDKAKALGYRNLMRYRDVNGKEDANRVGWHTGAWNRDAIWGSLIPAVNNRQLVIYNVHGLAQFKELIRNSDKGGRIEAQKGGNDDYPMAVGIAYYNRDQVHMNAKPLKVIQTATF